MKNKILILIVLLFSSRVFPSTSFVILGDAGTGDDGQSRVAMAIDNKCTTSQCVFALYAGDNFYDDGVSSVSDVQFLNKFETPYINLAFPFYVALGNHDYGKVPINTINANSQIEYANSKKTKFTLPNRYYKTSQGEIDIFVIDSNAIFFTSDPEQAAWLTSQLLLSTAKIKIVLGHHPYISNGEHGNAGHYEEAVPPGEPIVSGVRVKHFFDTVICGRADFYFSGHDHNLQWPKYRKDCDTHFIVSGAGAKTTPLRKVRNNAMNFEYDSSPGFVLATANTSVSPSSVHLEFFSADSKGKPISLYQKTITIEPKLPCPPFLPCISGLVPNCPNGIDCNALLETTNELLRKGLQLLPLEELDRIQTVVNSMRGEMRDDAKKKYKQAIQGIEESVSTAKEQARLAEEAAEKARLAAEKAAEELVKAAEKARLAAEEAARLAADQIKAREQARRAEAARLAAEAARKAKELHDKLKPKLPF